MTIQLDPGNPSSLTNSALAADQVTLNASVAVMSLAQAIAAKTGFVSAIFNGKRQLPIAFTVTAGAFSWDASDEAVNALSVAILAALISGTGSASQQTTLVGEINTALANLVSDVDGALSGLVSDVDTALADVANDTNTAFAGLITDAGAGFSATNTAFGNLVSDINSGIVAQVNGSSPASNVRGETVTPTISSRSIATRSVRAESVRAESVAGGTAGVVAAMTWTPLGQSSAVNLSGAEAAGLLNAILARRASLKQTQLTLAAGLAACASVAAIEALDVTGAWAY